MNDETSSRGDGVVRGGVEMVPREIKNGCRSEGEKWNAKQSGCLCGRVTTIESFHGEVLLNPAEPLSTRSFISLPNVSF